MSHTDENIDDSQIVDGATLRAVMGGFATGVTVVTTEMDGELHGMTANSLTSVSMNPPLLLVCFVRDSRTAQAVARRHAFVVNLLDRRQEAVSNRFARQGEDHFAEVEYHINDFGLPVLAGGLGHLVCDVHVVYDGGDHDIVVGLIRYAEARTGKPLVFYRGKYDTLTGHGRDAEFVWYW